MCTYAMHNGVLARVCTSTVQDVPVHPQDVVSWTELIAGCSRHGHPWEALSHFDRMQIEGVAPNAVTFVCILKACGAIGIAKKGEEFHSRIAREEFLEKNNVLGTTLVDMYAKCGAVCKARRVFDELLYRDVVSWTAIVAGYNRHGFAQEALQCFQQMNCEGVRPSAVTYSCILKACQTTEAMQKGREVHVGIVQNGLLENDAVLGNALVDMYAKFGDFENACQVLDGLPMRNVICWTAFISGHAQHAHAEEALNCFHQMQQEGHLPNQLTFVSTLKAHSSSRMIRRGTQIHVGIVTSGFLGEDLIIATALIDMYAKCGDVVNARQIFEELPYPSVASWNALIKGYHGQDNTEDALLCFKRMPHEGILPDLSTFSCILNVCGSSKSSKEGTQIHAAIMENLFLGKTSMLENALVDMYAKCGKLENAEKVFDRLPVQDVVPTTALISGYVHQGRSEHAITFFEQAYCKGLSPDAVIFTCTLQACGNIGAAEMGEKVHAEIVREGFLRNDTVLGNAVVDMYAKCGCLTKAQEVFDDLPAVDVVSWAVLIAGYVRLGHALEALSCFDRMQEGGQSPNAAIYACILQACADIGAGQKGKEIHKDIMNKGFLEKDVTIGNALLNMYTKCSDLFKVNEIFDKLNVRNVVSWTVIIMQYAQLGKHEIVFNLFQKMIGEGIEPDLVAFVMVLNACSYSGLVDEGRSYLESMTARFAINPTVQHHTCMVDLFAHAGNLDHAIKMINEMPPSEHGRMWYAFMGACQRWGNVKLGWLAFNHVVK